MDKWIGCDERLPKNGEVVRVLFEDMKEDTSKYCGGEFYIIPDWEDIKPITHWKSAYKQVVHTPEKD